MRRVMVLVLALAAAFGTLASPAFAEHILLGVADAKPTVDSTHCQTSPCTLMQTSSPEGTFTAPADGRIVAWWGATAIPTGSTGQLRVLRRILPLTQVKFQAIASSAVDTIDPHATHHTTDLPVQANDLIGLTLLTGFVDHEFDTGATEERFSGVFADGTAEISLGENKGATDEYGADFVFRPVVGSLDTTSGPSTGGGTMTIAGDHLTDSTQVLFGSTPATGMSVVSNTRITVQIPAGSGTVDVTVVGPGGSSETVATDQYTYLAASATVNPSVLDFGHTPVGQPSSVKSVTLTNSGKVTVAVSTVTLGGADAGDFEKLSDGCSGHNILAGSSCAVTLVFTPGGAGPRQASLRLGDNSSDGPHTVVLTGSGDNPSPAGTTTAATMTTTTATTTTTRPGAPSGAFTVGRPAGTMLRITVRARGTVRVASSLLLGSSAAGGPGAITVKLRLTAPARKMLAHRHRLSLHVRITFTPRGGKPATKTRSIVINAT